MDAQKITIVGLLVLFFGVVLILFITMFCCKLYFEGLECFCCKILSPLRQEKVHEYECSICLETLLDKTKDLSSLKCGHEFHKNCILEALKNSPLCPICKQNSRKGKKLMKNRVFINTYQLNKTRDSKGFSTSEDSNESVEMSFLN